MNKRLIHIDIAKGILIFFVIMGHTDFGDNFNIVHKLILWFHMPAFFIISGLFFENNNYNLIASCGKYLHRYVVPYISWCFLGFLIFPFEPISKNLIRIIYAGSINTTEYSYPFWFINTLLLGLLLLTFLTWLHNVILRKENYFSSFLILFAFSLFCFGHLMNKKIMDLPWGIGQLTLSFMFIVVGFIYKNKFKYYNMDKYFWLSSFLSLSFLCILIFINGFSFNIKAMMTTNVIVDTIMPCLITYSIFGISLILSRFIVISKLLGYIGKRCMTIFFSHAAVLSILSSNINIQNPVLNGFVLFFLTLIISLIICIAIQSNKYTKFFFIGK